MNEHEIERISAAMNQARPDWPTKQLRTLLAHPSLADRPRRDVFVALAWIACESGTASPYRVLESGPWWRAAAIEGQAQRREVLAPNERCGICAKPERRCRADRIADDDHEFEPDLKRDRGIDVASTVDALRELVVEAKAEPVVPEPRKTEPNPQVEALRAQLAAKTGDAA